jgi:hypothetical protein
MRVVFGGNFLKIYSKGLTPHATKSLGFNIVGTNIHIEFCAFGFPF